MYRGLSAESAALREFSQSKTSIEDCFILYDVATGARGIPNSICWEKRPETELTEYKFDKCGYRAGLECGPKRPGNYRIVMTGSSVALGERVPVQETLAALLPADLSRMTGRRVELYNRDMGYGFARSTALRFNPAAQAHPNFSNLIAKELTNGSVPVLKACAQTQIALEKGQ